MAFSEKIQQLINSSGQDAAISRAAQLYNHVNGIQKQLNPTDEIDGKQKTFADMLKASTGKNVSFGLPKNVSPEAQSNISLPYPTAGNMAPVSKPQIMNLISHIAKKHNMDEKLINAVITQESGFKTDAVSKAGAMGLMQLMPATAKGLGVTDPMNPIQNVDGGVRHLKGLMARYNGNLILALAAYNAGGGNVDKYGGVPPFAETQNYVKSILAKYLG